MQTSLNAETTLLRSVVCEHSLLPGKPDVETSLVPVTIMSS